MKLVRCALHNLKVYMRQKRQEIKGFFAAAQQHRTISLQSNDLQDNFLLKKVALQPNKPAIECHAV